MGSISVVTAFMASTPGTDAENELIEAFGEWLGVKQKKTIFGGGDIGLMGAFARAARLKGCPEVKGYIPVELHELLRKYNPDYKPVAHIEEVVPTIDIRKGRMIRECDLAITFPGGSGSMEEFWQFQVHQELSSYREPELPVSQMVLVNLDGYYDGLLQQVDTIIKKGKKHREAYNILSVVTSIETMLAKLDEIDSSPPMKGHSLLPPGYILNR
jgi:predicted Rossmann-fold nucleotide-binding protein